MAQVTLHLDDETAKALSDAASRSGMSRSRWVSRLIRRHAQDKRPQEGLALAGAFPDFPLSEPRAQASPPADSLLIPFCTACDTQGRISHWQETAKRA